jgi:hypothetical protein
MRGSEYQKTTVRSGQEENRQLAQRVVAISFAIGIDNMKIKFQLPAGTNIYPIIL